MDKSMGQGVILDYDGLEKLHPPTHYEMLGMFFQPPQNSFSFVLRGYHVRDAGRISEMLT